MTKILVVDDEDAIREVLKIRLDKWGFQVELAESGEAAIEINEEWEPEIVLSDVVMPGLSGVELLKTLKRRNREVRVVLITAHGEVETAVEAMKEGAEDFITKPIDYTHLKAILNSVKVKLRQREKTEKLKSQAKKGGDFGPFVGRSAPMRQLYRMIRESAPTDAAVLITGPSGTGKELVARTIHQLSSRQAGPFFAVNTAAIPTELMESELFGHEKGAFTGASGTREGCFELADKGTLFLDEISEMPVGLQTKLLRVLEDGRVRRIGSHRELQFDVRIVAATNREPQLALEEGKLREDLYFRLNVFTIAVPPLKERQGDIPALVQHFIADFNVRHGTQVEGVSDEVESLLKAYGWPGNVRELRNAVERATVLAKEGWIEALHLPPFVRQAAQQEEARVVLSPGIPLAEAERQLILKTLEATGGNKAETARRLGVDVKTIRNKLKEYENR